MGHRLEYMFCMLGAQVSSLALLKISSLKPGNWQLFISFDNFTDRTN